MTLGLIYQLRLRTIHKEMANVKDLMELYGKLFDCCCIRMIWKFPIGK